MRRFLIRNAAGEQVGGGVQWDDELLSYRLGKGEPSNVELSALQFHNDEGDRPESIRGMQIEWLDWPPE